MSRSRLSRSVSYQPVRQYDPDTETDQPKDFTRSLDRKRSSDLKKRLSSGLVPNRLLKSLTRSRGDIRTTIDSEEQDEPSVFDEPPEEQVHSGEMEVVLNGIDGHTQQQVCYNLHYNVFF